ncbi:MAG: hypothetical protein GYA51_05240 [Candidatus Methanofastidiosa archaeon]|nr:hypothetical protein [Candidatus Methanofastidiosa archaeon]
MKKIICMLIFLLFVASYFSIPATIAFEIEANATPEKVKVGQLITVTSNNYPYYDPVIKIYDPSIEQYTDWVKKSNAFKTLPDGSVYATKVSGPIQEGKYWVWIYRATKEGKIVFGAPVLAPSPPFPPGTFFWCPTNPVTINRVSHPMKSFMKILGFGKND